MNKAVLGLASLFVLASCAKKDSGDSHPASVWKIQNLTKDPIELTKQDQSCADSVFGESISYEIQRFMEGNKAFNQLDFTKQIYKGEVESSGITPIIASYYGKHNKVSAQVVYSAEEESYVIDTSVEPSLEVVREEAKLNVCPETTLYNPDSFEAAGLNISNTINETYNKLRQIDPKLDLWGIRLNVVPLIYKDVRFKGGENDMQRIVGYEADNAYYAPDDREITFLPQSKPFKDDYFETPLWEIPFVGSHEYGHHVFQSLVINKIQAEYEKSMGCFKRDSYYRNILHKVSGEERNNGSEFALGAINEGFADLIASYALGKKESSLKKLKCFTHNREIESKFFASGDKKRFGIISMLDVNSKKRVESDSDCETPDFQEIHDVGAIWAHTVDNLISKTTNDKDVKLRILLKWTEEVVAEVKKDNEAFKKMEAGEILFLASELMYKVALEVEAQLENSEEEDSPRTARTSLKLPCAELAGEFGWAYSKCRYLKNDYK